jgi:hypothetical protein
LELISNKCAYIRIPEPQKQQTPYKQKHSPLGKTLLLAQGDMRLTCMQVDSYWRMS